MAVALCYLFPFSEKMKSLVTIPQTLATTVVKKKMEECFGSSFLRMFWVYFPKEMKYMQ